jgi:hypothetical protein
MRFLRSVAPIVGLTLFLGACGTMQLPPRLTPDERTLVETHRFDAVVGVAPYSIEHTRKSVRAVVRDTGLFTRVDFVEDLEAAGVAPDLLVSVQRVSGGTSMIPILTLVSLGVLPTFTRETMGYDLIFATPDRSEAITVGYSFRGRNGMGILASPLNLLPGWDHPTRRPPERLGRRFAVEIAGRAEEIEALLADDD